MARMRIDQDGRIFDGNRYVGYVENDDQLYGFDDDGYAVWVGTIDKHLAIARLIEWHKR